MALQTMNAGVSPPAHPTLGTLWLETPQNATVYTLHVWDGRAPTFAGGVWETIASLDVARHVWMPPIGGGWPPNLISAATVDLGSVPQAALYVTGANTIQSFGSSAPPGAIKVVIFTGTAIVVQNPTSLIIPGGANVTQSNGDVLIALHLGNGNWKVLFDTKTSGGGGGGCSGSDCQIPLGLGLTTTLGIDNQSPLIVGSDTLFGQTFDSDTALSTYTFSPQDIAHLKTFSASSLQAATLPTAGDPGFQRGTVVCFLVTGAGGMTLGASGGVLLGVPTSSGLTSLPQYGNGCAESSPPNWKVSVAGPVSATTGISGSFTVSDGSAQSCWTFTTGRLTAKITGACSGGCAGTVVGASGTLGMGVSGLLGLGATASCSSGTIALGVSGTLALGISGTNALGVQ